MRVAGGVPPFTFSFFAGASGLYANATSTSNSSVTKIANPIPANQHFTMFVTDGTGNTSVVSQTMTSKIGLAGCNEPTPSSSTADDDASSAGTSLPLGGIIGGALGGVFLALGLLAVVLFCLKKRKARELALEQELDSNIEYLKKDGTAPLVVPFVLPERSENSSVYGGNNPFGSADGDHSWDSKNRHSAFASAVHSRRPSSFGTPSPSDDQAAYVYPPPGAPDQQAAYPGASSVHQRSYTATTGDHLMNSPQEDPVSSSAFDARDPMAVNRYSDPYGDNEFGQATSVDGLAHPETFAYR